MLIRPRQLLTPPADADPVYPRLAAAAVAVLCTVMITIWELLTPPNITPSLFYCVPLVASAWTHDRRFVWSLTAVLVGLTYLTLLWGPSPLLLHPGMFVLWANRSLMAVSIVLLAGFVHVWIRAHEELLASGRAIEERSITLEKSNLDLAAREEEIARQNAELQSQSEELERQTEELRVANDELVHREAIMAQLLTLSRTLATELTAGQVVSTVCDSLTDLLSGAAGSALLLIEGDHLRTACHVGFGEGGPDRTEIPYQSSFAALLTARSQTAFLEDIHLRPDLQILQPRAAAPFRSVLGAPLWVRGRVIGTLEAYSRVPSRWSEGDINLITSMAAQTSISLETARLFEEVEHARERFATVFRTLPICVLVSDDADCRHVSGNAAAAAIFSVAADVNFSPFVTGSARVRQSIYLDGVALAPKQFPLCHAVLSGEELHAKEFEVVVQGGRRLTILVSAAPFYDAEGKVSGGVCAFVDITVQKNLERELEMRRRESEEASVRKTRFLAALSHDIRTPANAIRLQAELIRRGADNPAVAAKIPELAQQLQANAVSLVDLVGEVLDLTRFETGKIDLQENDFSLAETIRDECNRLAPLAQAKGIALHCESIDPALWLRADRIKLGRVLGNLIENAIKFTAAGEVRVGARRGLQAIELRVTDTGVGIAPEHQARVFDEFFQLRNPERDQSKGRGLGLAICRRLVDAMGGDIRVERSAPGAGTTFLVTFPTSSVIARGSAPAALERAYAPRPRLAGLRLLLVEDHEDTRRATAEFLAAEGAAVTAVGDGAAALRAVPQLQPEVLLLDLMLPDMDGLAVLRALREQGAGTLRRVFVLTGDSASCGVDELQRLGIDAVIEKPIDPDALVVRLREVVASVRGPDR